MHPLPEHLLARPAPESVPLMDVRAPLRAVIASLALGGAERIVLEWAADALASRLAELPQSPRVS